MQKTHLFTTSFYFYLPSSPDSSNFRCSEYYRENLPEAMPYVGLMLVPYSSNNLPPVPCIFQASKALISSKRCFHGPFGMGYFHRLHSMTPQESCFRKIDFQGGIRVSGFNFCECSTGSAWNSFENMVLKEKFTLKEESQGWTSCKFTWTFPFQQTNAGWLIIYRCSSRDFGYCFESNTSSTFPSRERWLIANFSKSCFASCVCLYLPSLKLT